MKKITLLLSMLLIALSVTGCGEAEPASSAEASKETAVSTEVSKETSSSAEASEEEWNDTYFSEYDCKTKFDEDDTTITFDGTNVTYKGTGVSVTGTTVTISKDGTYVVSGTCSDGRIIIEVKKEDKVRLVLNGLNLTNTTGAAIWVQRADKVVISLAEGSKNVLEDAAKYTDVNADEEPNACIFSKDDLTINGTGELSVVSNSNNGIGSKDDLKIAGGTITVSAKNNALKGNDSVSIKDATITVTKCDDAIKTSNEEDADKGFVYIRSGVIDITSSDDAIQSTQKVIIEGGSITVKAKGDTINCDGDVQVASGVITEK